MFTGYGFELELVGGGVGLTSCGTGGVTGGFTGFGDDIGLESTVGGVGGVGAGGDEIGVTDVEVELAGGEEAPWSWVFTTGSVF